MNILIKGTIKLAIQPEKASAGPPVGAMLGQYGVNIMQFCKDFNNKSSIYHTDALLNVTITVYTDGSFTYVLNPFSISSKLKELSIENQYISIRWIYELAKLQQRYNSNCNAVPLKSIVKSIISTAKSFNYIIIN